MHFSIYLFIYFALDILFLILYGKKLLHFNYQISYNIQHQTISDYQLIYFFTDKYVFYVCRRYWHLFIFYKMLYNFQLSSKSLSLNKYSLIKFLIKY